MSLSPLGMVDKRMPAHEQVRAYDAWNSLFTVEQNWKQCKHYRAHKHNCTYTCLPASTRTYNAWNFLFTVEHESNVSIYTGTGAHTRTNTCTHADMHVHAHNDYKYLFGLLTLILFSVAVIRSFAIEGWASILSKAVEWDAPLCSMRWRGFACLAQNTNR